VTKRDFIALADELRGLEVPADVMGAIVRFREGRNPRFLEARWLGYFAGECGPSSGPKKRPATALQKVEGRAVTRQPHLYDASTATIASRQVAGVGSVIVDIEPRQRLLRATNGGTSSPPLTKGWRLPSVAVVVLALYLFTTPKRTINLDDYNGADCFSDYYQPIRTAWAGGESIRLGCMR
jgi:hypothetical protein